jgi:sugar phosphate isomerase/epimerase
MGVADARSGHPARKGIRPLNRHFLALDHLTVADTTPVALVETAHATGCRAICLFMQPMDVLPRMPQFDLYGDVRAQRDLRSRMEALGIGLDLAYPFTLAGRTDIDGFIPVLDCAATLGARAVNVLAYDREPARRVEKFGAFCELARARGLSVAVEFYPLSQARNLAEAIALTAAIGRPGEVGVNVDLLHLVRSGGTLAELADAPAGSILYAQQCDGPASYDRARWDFEASSQRLLAGQGVFDLAGFAAALPADCPVSVELPQDDALAAGVPVLDRARRAVDGVLAVTGAA